MKNVHILKSIILIITIFFSAIVTAQTTHTIILTCDTTDITNENVNDVCSFGQDSNIPNKDYTIDVNIGDVILWRGIAKNTELSSTIEIKEVNYVSGKNVFGENSLRSRGGLVTAEVIEGQPGDEEKYDLTFRVYVDGRRLNATFTIDPKIRVYR